MTQQSVFSLSRRGFVLVGASAALSACVSRPTNKGIASGARDETAAALPMVNELRRSKGLGTLSANSAAQQAALYQASRMVKAQKMAHLIGLTDSFLIRMRDGGVPLPAAENVAAGQDTVERVVKAWIGSPHHLENMLGNYGGLGVAVAYDAAANNRPYWAMVLCR
ncbi:MULTISPECIES: CAP domain-containing protein [unclassified Rhizobium]|uniref:CAP domain-containing protein n=1 Tax=unclassified Rhizobium TaxID=2613769 RepID=UPI0017849E09|nr:MULTISPECIES: CAP domain-containing protein [unclassified Rhizobium]MBD8685983.1 CAP domain-containing protein [Rhizobium sp. CFBP 13644]MBD8690344.1 CAP domain-containing protein [Rhizobium sp. CFBP 13717]